jgi:protein TonB
VDKEGNVVEPRVAGGSENQLLGQEAVDAVSKLDCKPGMKGDELAKMSMELPVVLQKSEEPKKVTRKPDCGVNGPVQHQVASNFAADVSGERVVVQFAVDKEGNVVEPRVAGGSENQLLGQEAVDAVSNLDCKPGMESGEPAKMTSELPVVFQKEAPQITRKPDCGVNGPVQHQVTSNFAADVSGERVVVQFAVDKEGNVVEPRVAGGSENQLLGQEAVDAVSNLDCKPGMESGEPVKMTSELPVVFQKEEPQITRKPDCGGKEAVQNRVEYPDFARKANIEGRVVVRFDVDENGDVISPRATDGSKNQLLRQAAVDAVNKLDCKPGVKSGESMEMAMELPVDFELDGL